MALRTSPLKQRELEEALRLLRRPEGACTKDLEPVLRAATCDVAWKLRNYLKNHYPKLKLTAEKMSRERRNKEGYRGPTFVYRVVEEVDTRTSETWRDQD